jgi:hypothetical protein
MDVNFPSKKNGSVLGLIAIPILTHHFQNNSWIPMTKNSKYAHDWF